MVTAYISLNTTATVVPNTAATAFHSSHIQPHTTEIEGPCFFYRCHAVTSPSPVVISLLPCRLFMMALLPHQLFPSPSNSPSSTDALPNLQPLSSQASDREGRPHSYCLHAEVAGHGQAPCKGGQPWPGYLQGAAAHNGSSPQGAATRGHSRLQPARKGLPPVASPATSRGDVAGRRGDRPLAGQLSAVKGSRHLRRGSGGDAALRVKEG
ncbi:hypothetical protein B296_00003279 [Ensete ventricosum]|uniref:Uncharacterized protein n=1 Tax=Ensete ventricosum TaxID=4639 RepID=A0A426YES2_ENSVE|nr:hypothetical protein B296_00003279 [Ensete ventricosum]